MTDPPTLKPVGNQNSTSFENRFNLILVAEGFTSDDYNTSPSKFAARCEAFNSVLRGFVPFNEFPWRINVFRIDTVSRETAETLSDDCKSQPPPHANDTSFRTKFCASQTDEVPPQPIARSIFGDGTEVLRTITGLLPSPAPQFYPIVVINSDLPGGVTTREQRGSLVSSVSWFTIKDGWEKTAIHELGHGLFDLDDEYECEGTVVAPPDQSVGPNTTTSSTRAALATEPTRDHHAWTVMIGNTTTPSTTAKVPKPTAPDNPRTFDAPLAVGVLPGAVGLFEGARNHQFGIYRPTALSCRMREGFPALCPVCAQAVRTRLTDAELPRERAVSVPVALASHVLTLPFLKPAIATYDSATSAFQVFDGLDARLNAEKALDLFAPSRDRPTIGCTTVLAFPLDSDAVGLYTYDLTVHRVYSVVKDSTGAVRARLDWEQDLGVAVPWSSISLVQVNGRLQALGYSLAGHAAMWQVDTIPPQGFTASWLTPDRLWQPGVPHVEAFNFGGRVVVLRGNGLDLPDLQTLDPAGTGPDDVTFRPRATSSGEPIFFDTHYLLYIDQDPQAGVLRVEKVRLLRYAAATGRLSLDAMRSDASDFDFLGSKRTVPNGLCLLGFGMPVFASFVLPSTLQLSGRRILAWHHRPTGRLFLHDMRLV